MAISLSNSADIVARAVAFEVLGMDPPAAREKDKFVSNWVRCFVEFENLRGQDVIDIPVISDLPDDKDWYLSDRALHVSEFRPDKVRDYVFMTIGKIRGSTAKQVFSQLDKIGFSDSTR